MPIEERRIPAGEILPRDRIMNFDEIYSGYTNETAIEEAKRCRSCRKKPCVSGCLLNIDIPGFIKAVAENRILLAKKIINSSNSYPAICGRLCPQEKLCASACILGNKYESINIGMLERYVADYKIYVDLPNAGIDNSKPSLAVVGSGPAGLTIASDMASHGYPVVIYEALPKAGGSLRYGVPNFRLPDLVLDRELERLFNAGVKIKTNCVVGRVPGIKDLLKMHAAVFLGIGKGVPKYMGIKGEKLCGVFSANEYLTRNNLMKSYLYPEYHTPVKKGENVVVVGDNDQAVDSARTAIRLGAKSVHIISKCGKKNMAASKIEIDNAVKEGIKLMESSIPVEIAGSGENVCAVKCVKIKEGYSTMTLIPGSGFIVDADMVIIAIGLRPNMILKRTVPELELDTLGYIKVNRATFKTNIYGVYAAGDIVRISSNLTEIMASAKNAAVAIREFFNYASK